MSTTRIERLLPIRAGSITTPRVRQVGGITKSDDADEARATFATDAFVIDRVRYPLFLARDE
jgi:hypothetical protein